MSMLHLLWIIPLSCIITAGLIIGYAAWYDWRQYRKKYGNKRQEEF